MFSTNKLPKFHAGAPLADQLTETTLNQLVEYIRSNTPIAGIGMRITRTASGSICEAARRTSSAGTELLPLQPYDASTGSTPGISVWPGTFGQNAEASSGDSVPTISGTRIDNATPPVLTVSGSDTVIYLHESVDSSGKITASVVASGTSVPTSTATDAYVQLCIITVTTGASASVKCSAINLSGSQSFELCGGVTPIWYLT